MSIANSSRMLVLLLRNSSPSCTFRYSFCPFRNSSPYPLWGPIVAASRPTCRLTALPLLQFSRAGQYAIPIPNTDRLPVFFISRLLTIFPIYRLSVGRIPPILSAYLPFSLYRPPDYLILLYYLSIYNILHVLAVYQPCFAYHIFSLPCPPYTISLG